MPALVRPGLVRHGLPIRCLLRNTTAQSISQTTWTSLQFASGEEEDYRGMHSTSSNNTRINVPVTGAYTLNAFANFSTTIGPATVFFRFLLDGSTVISQVMFVSGVNWNPQPAHSDTAFINAGSYVEAQVWHNGTPSTPNISTKTFRCVLQPDTVIA